LGHPHLRLLRGYLLVLSLRSFQLRLCFSYMRPRLFYSLLLHAQLRLHAFDFALGLGQSLLAGALLCLPSPQRPIGLIQVLARHYALIHQVLHARQGPSSGVDAGIPEVDISLGRSHCSDAYTQTRLYFVHPLLRLLQGTLGGADGGTSAGRAAARTVLRHGDLNLLTLQVGRSDLYRHFGLFDAHLEVAWIKLGQDLSGFHLLVVFDVHR
jgi:hypothetical protein